MKNFIKCLSALTLVLSSYAYSEVTVIVHPSNAAALDQKSISKIFLGKSSSFPGGGKAVPINLAEGNATTNEFNDKVLGKKSSQLKSYWSKLVFTGKGTPPKEVGSDQDVIDLVSKNPNIIGYVTSGVETGDVKVVAKF